MHETKVLVSVPTLVISVVVHEAPPSEGRSGLLWASTGVPLFVSPHPIATKQATMAILMTDKGYTRGECVESTDDLFTSPPRLSIEMAGSASHVKWSPGWMRLSNALPLSSGRPSAADPQRCNGLASALTRLSPQQSVSDRRFEFDPEAPASRTGPRSGRAPERSERPFLG